MAVKNIIQVNTIGQYRAECVRRMDPTCGARKIPDDSTIVGEAMSINSVEKRQDIITDIKDLLKNRYEADVDVKVCAEIFVRGVRANPNIEKVSHGYYKIK